jgi:hypothetical protein
LKREDGIEVFDALDLGERRGGGWEKEMERERRGGVGLVQ